MGVGLFYGAFIIVGGLLALLLKTIAVAAASSLGGSYAVFWGKYTCITLINVYLLKCHRHAVAVTVFKDKFYLLH
jgi:hypothetical protein